MFSSAKEPDLLNNIDIQEICAMLGIPLQGVYSKDELINVEPEPNKCYIINLEDSTGGGTHWVTVVINNNYVSYFDSFGVRASDDVKEFISRFVKNQGTQTIYSTQQIQSVDSVLCGYYCIYFCYFHTVLHGDDEDNKRLMNKHNSLYVDIFNLKFNDKIIQKLIKNIIL
jgi:hypothetical protein